MLSYQHAYHAGNRADIHKHAILCAVLEILTRKERPLSYMETHAGRGVYDLAAAEAVKTGEAGEGWLKLSGDKKFLSALPPPYIAAVQALNGGGLAPRYPGSPYLAAHVLRAQDRMHLMELHPQEHAALEKNFRNDPRIRIHRRDGLEGVQALAPPRAPEPRRGLVLIDPSYELKEEYEKIAAFAPALLRRWPEAGVLVWVPVLAAGRYEVLIETIRQALPGVLVSEARWEAAQGIKGSIMLGLNMPHTAEEAFLRRLPGL